METKEIQREQTVLHLRQHKGITSYEAYSLYGITRISAIIFNLRKKGMNIESVWQQGKNRYGKDVRYVRYELRGEEQ